jgi:CHAT domain-containing protein
VYCPGEEVPCAYFRILQAEAQAIPGDWKAAQTGLRAPLPPALVRSRFEVRRRYIQALAAWRKTDLAGMEEHLRSAESLAREVAPEMLPELQSLRAVTLVKDDPNCALFMLEGILAAARRQGDLFLQVSALGNIGYALMYLDRWTDALDRLEEVRRIFLQAAGHESYKTIGNIGNCYRMLGDFEQAADYYRRALKGATEQNYISDQLVWMTNLADIEQRLERLTEAKAQLLQTLELARAANLPDKVAETMSALSSLSLELDDYLAAARYNDDALRRFQKLTDERGHLEASIDAARLTEIRGELTKADAMYREIIDKATEIRPLRWRAQAQRAMMYARRNEDEEAEEQFREALKTVDEARRAVDADEHRLSFDNLVTSFFGSYIGFLAARGRTEDALAIAEHARAQTLEEALGVRGPGLALDPRDAARAFGGVVLSYWLGDRGSHLWVITARDIRRVDLPPRAEVEGLIGEYSRYLQQASDPLRSHAGARLYELLVAPAGVAAGARVAIVPAGRLYELNFETLIATAPQPHYWIEDATITTSSSVALLAAGSRRSAPQGDELLLVGNAPSPDPEQFSPLRNAREEVRLVAARFPKHEVLQEKAATPAAYLAKEPQAFAFIHFVAHAVPASLRPLDSSIILARDGSNSYRLTARDVIRQPKLHARLVTISSCHGAGIRAYAGEGLVGLAWAFLRAGSHQVVAALWEVNDGATPELMDSMYSGIRAGRDPASALRDAKLRLLHADKVTRHPKYWAPFMLYSGA